MEPFRPFRISMASGRSFDIRHPEMVQVGRSSLTIFSFVTEEPTNGEEAEQKERMHEISLMLIEAVEPLDIPSQSNS